jgi:DME family drug/metabolite transporter
LGELAGLASALLWATTNIVLRGPALRLGAVTVNAWRAFFAALAFFVVFALTRHISDLAAIPPRALAALLTAVLVGMVIGDALQLTALGQIGVARAMPIGASFPLFTVVLAALFLHETVTIRTFLGALLVIVGVVLLAVPQGAREAAAPLTARQHWVGVGLALTAACCWAVSTTLTRVAVEHIDVVIANTVRLPVSATMSALFGLGRAKVPARKFGWQNFAILALAGVFGTAGGGFLYLVSVSLAGAAKSSILSAFSPVFGLVGAVLFLHERPGTRGLVGTLIAVGGIVLVV